MQLNLNYARKKSVAILFIVVLFSGCAIQDVVKRSAKPTDYIVVMVERGDTLESLAEKHIGTPELAWRIADFNGIDALKPGSSVVIPLHPINVGGISANGYQTVPVLTYHNFSKTKKNRMTVTTRDFETQMQYLKDNGFNVITIDQFFSFLEFGEIPKKSVVISIDDGWRSAYEIAYPILKRHGFTATLFITTGQIDRGRKHLSWKMVREMTEDGTMQIHAHTISHRDLTKRQPGESFERYFSALVREIQEPRRLIKEKTGHDTNFFAYPYGETDQLVIEILRKSGYKAAFTVDRKSNPVFTDNFRLGRSMIYGTYSLEKFAKNLSNFEQTAIDPALKIDTKKIALDNSTALARSDENREFWNSAQIRWKLARDVTRLTNANRSEINQATVRINEISRILNRIAQNGINEANTLMREGKRDEAFLSYYKVLLANPEHSVARTMIKNLKSTGEYVTVNLTPETTSDEIAINVYKDPKKSILVDYLLTDTGSGSAAGSLEQEQIKLPVFDDIAVTKVAATSKTECGIEITQPKSELANVYFVRGNKFFDSDDVGSALDAFQTAVCLDPKHEDANEMLLLLQQL